MYIFKHYQEVKMESGNEAQTAEKDKSAPSAGERVFAGIFCFFYLILMIGVIGIIVVLIISAIFKEFPKNVGFLLVFVLFGLYPHAKKAVAERLAETRGMSAMTRLGKIVAAIHS
jgi:hypothetical protein